MLRLLERSTHLLYFDVILLLMLPLLSSQLSLPPDGHGRAAREAHAAAALIKGGTKLPITAKQEIATKAMQQWLEAAYEQVDYAAVLEATDEVSTSYLSTDDETTTYGEFPLSFFLALLDHLAPPATASFLDLGSGRGQLVLAAAKYRTWMACRGVEITPELHFIARDAGQWACKNIRATHDVELAFTLGDIYKQDIGRQDEFVFCYATCLEVDDAGTLARLYRCLQGLKAGATVVTINRPLVPILRKRAPMADLVTNDGIVEPESSSFELQEILKGPNPEAEADGLLSVAFVWKKLPCQIPSQLPSKYT